MSSTSNSDEQPPEALSAEEQDIFEKAAFESKDTTKIKALLLSEKGKAYDAISGWMIIDACYIGLVDTAKALTARKSSDEVLRLVLKGIFDEPRYYERLLEPQAELFKHFVETYEWDIDQQICWEELLSRDTKHHLLWDFQGCDTIFQFAVGQRHVPIVRYLLSSKKIKPEMLHTRTLDKQQTVLHLVHNKYMGRKGRGSNILKALLAHGADEDAQDVDGNTPLMKVVEYMRDEHCNRDTLLEHARILLVEGKASIDIVNKRGLNAYAIARDFCRRMLELEALLVEHKGCLCASSLVYFGKRGNWDLVKSFVNSSGVHSEQVVNTSGDLEDGSTLLMVATDNNNINMIQWLLDKRADVNMANEKTQTALHLAKDVEACQVLLDAGANVHICDDDGNTPLLSIIQHWYCNGYRGYCVPWVTEQALAMVEKLVDGGGADIHHVNKAGDNIFIMPFRTVEKWNEVFAEIFTERFAEGLLKKGFSAVNEQADHAIVHVATRGKTFITRLLLNARLAQNGFSYSHENHHKQLPEEEDERLSCTKASPKKHKAIVAKN